MYPMGLCQLSRQNVLNIHPIVATCSLVVKSDCSCIFRGHQADPSHILPFDETPLLQRVHSLNTCVDNPDTKIITIWQSARRMASFYPEAKCSCLPGLMLDSVCPLKVKSILALFRCSIGHLLTEGTQCEDCIYM